MKLGTFSIVTGALMGLAMGTTPVSAQPLWDVVHVNLPYTVAIGDKTLQPGEYTIEQNREPSGASRVLLIYSNQGMKFETSAMTIPTLDPDTARDTKVVLHHVGADYYFDKIWIQGKDYGYEFPLPHNVKDREKEMASVSVPASYSTTASKTEMAATASQNPAPAVTADNHAPSTPPNPPASTLPANPPLTSTPDNAANSANREMNDQRPSPSNPPQSATPADQSADRAMPATSAGWLMMLLGGGSLSGLGLALRRKR